MFEFRTLELLHMYTAFLVTCDKQSHLLIKPCCMQLLHFAPDTPQCRGETVDHLHTLPSPAGPVPHFFFNTMEGININSVQFSTREGTSTMNLYKELEDPSIPPLSHGSAYDGYLGLKKNSRKQ